MAAGEDSVNFKKLEQNVQSAIEADAKYWRENDAKLRAIKQSVATYEEFRDIVKASHLKPLQKDDKINSLSKRIWNPLVSGIGKSCIQNQMPSESSSSENLSKMKIPASSDQFEKMWKQLKSKNERFTLLKKLQGSNLFQSFSTEMPSDLLGQILSTLKEFDNSVDDYAFVIEILTALSCTKRFGLNLQFLSQEMKEECRLLFQKLWNSMSDKQQDLVENGITELTINNLMVLYEVDIQ